MQLFTITFDKLTLSGDDVLRVRTSIHDLPAPTVEMYRSKMQNLNFVVERQSQIAGERRDFRKGNRTRGEVVTMKSASAPGRSTIQEAAASGDLAAAINER